jgi:hypothetical protein
MPIAFFDFQPIGVINLHGYRFHILICHQSLVNLEHAASLQLNPPALAGCGKSMW